MTSLTSDPFATAEQAVADTPRDLLIRGQWERTSATFAVMDPGSGRVIAEVADAAPTHALRALDAAAGAAAAWAATDDDARAALLRATAARMRASAEELAALITYEMGKPLAEARGEVAYAAAYFDHFALQALRSRGSVAPSATNPWTLAVERVPVGPCVLVTPWNFPAAMVARKLAPALAAGCTAVLKPSELTPLTALALARILTETGVPDGVVNVVPTTDAPGVVGALLADPRTRKLSFTGSTAVGQKLMVQAAENVLRLSLELGGDAPLIVCADADLDAAVEGALLAKLRNGGQACTAANRLIVEDAVAADFTERLAARFATLRVGHGLDPETDLGPLIDGRAVVKAQRVVAAARAGGARVITGAHAPDGASCGTFFPATILAGAVPEEEVFAPVAPIVAVPDVDAAVALANATDYGLAGYVFAGDAQRAAAIARRLDVGMAGVNTGLLSDVAAPFGGVKRSGLGREGGAEGLDEYLESRYLAVAA